MLILDETRVTQLFGMDDAIAALEGAFRAQSRGETHFPLRNMARSASGLLGAMPALLGGSAPALGAKLVTFFPGNATRDIHTHNALIALFNPETGEPLALMDGRYITEIRTGAASALATRPLAQPHARSLAILGSGVQARSHLEALSRVMKIEQLRVWSRTQEHADAFARWAMERHALSARTCGSADDACKGSDVICTVTASSKPLFDAGAVESGAHVNAVGSSAATMRELPAELLTRARIFVDSFDGARAEAGDILSAIAEGALPKDPPMTLLADTIEGKAEGRTSDTEITVFKSLGIGIEDVACAAVVYERAKENARR